MRYCDVLDDLQRQEDSWLGLPVVAPRIAGCGARVTVDGLAWECRVEGGFEGWGIFRIGRDRVARLVREADGWERDEWARRRPVHGAVLLETGKSVRAWFPSLHRILTVHLADGMERFEAVRAAFDGARCWMLGPDPRIHPARAAALRERLVGSRRNPWDEVPLRGRVEAALALGEAQLHACVEEADGGARVTWTKDGRTITSRVTPTLQVEDAGFCLSGTDREHDLISLASLVGRSI